MNDVSKNLKISFNNILTFYKEIALMLQDADVFLEVAGYKSLDGNSISVPISRHMNFPSKWLYPYVARYYIREENPLQVKALGIIFVDPGHVVVNPLILIGCFDYQPNDEGMPNYHWDALQEAWFNYVNEQTFDEDHTILEGLKHVNQGKIRGIKIENVISSDTLEEIVIKPLLSMSC